MRRHLEHGVQLCGLQHKGGCGTVGVGPQEGQSGDQGAGAPLYEDKLRVGVVQSGEGKALEETSLQPFSTKKESTGKLERNIPSRNIVTG